MSWSGGTDIFIKIIESLEFHLPDNEELRKELYQDLLDIFEDADWDNPEECVGIDSAYDEVYTDKYLGRFTIELDDDQ